MDTNQPLVSPTLALSLGQLSPAGYLWLGYTALLVAAAVVWMK
jgi:hypothetical protein